MGDTPHTRSRFAAALAAIAEGEGGPAAQTAALRRALLDFASETPDNFACAGRIEVGTVGDTTGAKLAGRAALLSDIAHAVEDGPVPDSLRAAYPDIADQEWEAFCRLTTLLYTLLSRKAV